MTFDISHLGELNPVNFSNWEYIFTWIVTYGDILPDFTTIRRTIL